MDTIKILYLEDSEYDAEILARVLGRAGFRFDMKLVNTRDEYCSALRNYCPDVVLSDHSLFEFSSIEALEIFKKFKFRIPFLLVTGGVSEEIAVSVLTAGADDYVLKSNLTRLPMAINRALREKKVEREREEAHNNLALFFKNINDVFFSIDWVNNKLIQISNGCMGVYGYPPEKFINEINILKDVVHPDDIDRVLESYTQLTQKETLYTEYRILKPDNSICWVGTKIVPSFNANCKLVRVDGVTTEITRRKKAEDELRQKCYDLNTLIYKITHDIRGPVATTAGLLNLATKEVYNNDASKYFSMLAASNNKLEKVVNGMLQLIKIDTQVKLSQKIDFEAITSKVITPYRVWKNTEDIKFITTIEPLTDFRSDGQLIYILLNNLVNNAVTYRKYQGVQVQVGIFNKDNNVIIEVQDNGIGIADEHHKKVFDIFYKANQYAKGAGLGLYLVKNIVEKLNGTVILDSEEDVGTTVQVMLPYIQHANKYK